MGGTIQYDKCVCARVCVCRRVVEYGTYVKHLKVEVYLVELKLCVHPHINETKVRFFSRADLTSELTVGVAVFCPSFPPPLAFYAEHSLSQRISRRRCLSYLNCQRTWNVGCGSGT